MTGGLAGEEMVAVQRCVCLGEGGGKAGTSRGEVSSIYLKCLTTIGPSSNFLSPPPPSLPKHIMLFSPYPSPPPPSLFLPSFTGGDRKIGRRAREWRGASLGLDGGK